jgi:hypothetical protein
MTYAFTLTSDGFLGRTTDGYLSMACPPAGEVECCRCLVYKPDQITVQITGVESCPVPGLDVSAVNGTFTCDFHEESCDYGTGDYTCTWSYADADVSIIVKVQGPIAPIPYLHFGVTAQIAGYPGAGYAFSYGAPGCEGLSCLDTVSNESVCGGTTTYVGRYGTASTRAGDYTLWTNDGTTYDEGDRVEHNGQFYVCIQGHVSATATTEPGAGTQWDWYWEVVSCTWSAWATGTRYTAGRWVTHDGTTYGCISTHDSGADNEPGVGPSWTTYWVAV